METARVLVPVAFARVLPSTCAGEDELALEGRNVQITAILELPTFGSSVIFYDRCVQPYTRKLNQFVALLYRIRLLRQPSAFTRISMILLGFPRHNAHPSHLEGSPSDQGRE
jgi:hypothetical protein